MASENIKDLLFGFSPRKLDKNSDKFSFMQYIHPDLMEITATFIEDGAAQFLSKQMNIAVSDFPVKKKGRARDFCRDPQPYFNEFVELPAVEQFISKVNDCFMAMVSDDVGAKPVDVDLQPVAAPSKSTDDLNTKKLEMLSKLQEDMTKMITCTSTFVDAFGRDLAERQVESASYRDAVMKNIEQVKLGVDKTVSAHSGTLMYHINRCTKAALPATILNFRCKKEILDARIEDGGKVAMDSTKLRSMINEILVDDEDLNVSQRCSVSKSRIIDDDVLFRLEFKSSEDHDMIWEQRFTLGKKYNLYVDIILPTKQSKVRAALVGEWHKFKQHKIQKGEEVSKLLKLAHGMVFESKLYKFDSMKSIGLFKRKLNEMCNGDLYNSDQS